MQIVNEIFIYVDNLNITGTMGVITVSDVDYGRIFGPFPDVCSVPASHFIGYITADVRPDTGCVKV